MQSHEQGQYVEWRDYTWLLAEKQRLDNNCDYLDQKLDEEIEKSAMLCGQVERMTKAGDAMAEEIALAKRQDEGSRFDPIEMHYDHELIVKWNAAKEGNQS